MADGITPSAALTAALELPKGARFYRCALQVNPFGYLKRHNKPSKYATEAEYNADIVGACLHNKVEVIAVTDHYRVDDSLALINAARAAGVFAFGGFEAVTKDGVHLICLFDPDKDQRLERFIGECGIHDPSKASPTGNKDVAELLEAVKRWGGICIAAHAAGDGGLLQVLKGQPRINAWTSDDLLACALPGPADQAPDNLRSILKNVDPQHRRDRPIAVINAQDVYGPEDLAKPAATTFIKMSTVTVEGLRQAFLDPNSRIRLNSDFPPEPHAEFLAAAWEGGFLDGTRLHLNGNLNVLVGGRGTGKSTIIESLRYVLGLDPLGDEAKKAHEGVLRYVLKSGTKVSLLIRSHHPSERCYTIERTIPNPPVVKDEVGSVLPVTPRNIIPGVEVFGQHEISELAKSREKLTLLLERFVERDPGASAKRSKLRVDLERSRARIGEIERDVKAIDDRLATLPSLEETLKRFQDAGLEDRLKEKSLLVREERVWTVIDERLAPYNSVHRELGELLPVDVAFLAPKALEGLPNASILGEASEILERLSKALKALAGQLSQALAGAERELAVLRTTWDDRRQAAEATYERLLRELQKSKVDGAEFIRLRRQIEELRPLRERRESLVRDLSAHQANRRQLLDEWVNLQSAEGRALSAAAKRVSRKLQGRVQVEVLIAGNREPLERLVREVGGNLSAAIERLKARAEFSAIDFAARLREGKEALIGNYSLPPAAADRLAQAGAEFSMRIEELELPATTKIELNTAAEGDVPSWQTLEALSTGQKATAVLLLLLLESKAPLVVDQPEDDLDNRFITDGVVPTMKDEKRRRQFLFSTHNANIPVLGDAELIVGLSTAVQDDAVHGRVNSAHMGSIDARPVRELVEEILEGGKTAFEMRRLKYGF